MTSYTNINYSRLGEFGKWHPGWDGNIENIFHGVRFEEGAGGMAPFGWLRHRIVVSARHATYDGMAVTTILCRSQLYPPFRDYEFGYSSRATCEERQTLLRPEIDNFSQYVFLILAAHHLFSPQRLRHRAPKLRKGWKLCWRRCCRMFYVNVLQLSRMSFWGIRRVPHSSKQVPPFKDETLSCSRQRQLLKEQLPPIRQLHFTVSQVRLKGGSRMGVVNIISLFHTVYSRINEETFLSFLMLIRGRKKIGTPLKKYVHCKKREKFSSMGSKSYMIKGFLIYEEIFNHESSSYMTLHPIPSIYPYIWGIFLFFFNSTVFVYQNKNKAHFLL